ncbi:ABC transporter permease [Aquabacterium sp. OR-4]|uniref:ABC transporter permease n=1 Tax=Aquabacterium sp. OR-4 TaxID=2978127 RepID=UPI0021B36303|nr:ABC transporter permease [Aquabacterium sp. OR-4]MDT7833956.1 ABC transporter permease [Aquabacterium sp. OR-4]
MSQPVELPRWVDIGVLPLVNLAMALAVSAIVVAVIGLDPVQVITQLVKGAFGTRSGLSYTLYYATTFTFTGLAVAVAFHGGLFNIGGEGQALVGGLAVAAVSLAFGPSLPALLMLPLAVAAAMAGGAAWAAVPAALQAWRGSHVVITTIMFNFIASALLAWLLVNHLKAPGGMTVETVAFADSAHLPGMHELLAAIGLDWPRTPLNASLLLAGVAAVGVWALLWRLRAGYELRAVGHSAEAAHYAGIHPKRQVMLAMLISGALAGMVGINELSGVQHKLLLDFVAGAGFTGIAVSLIGRNHPLGIVLAALLFGALFQGGAELAFEVPGFSRDMVTTLQGLIVLFSGAMARVAAPALGRLVMALQPAAPAATGAAHG